MNQKTSPWRDEVFLRDRGVTNLQLHHVAGLRPFGALFDREFNPVALFQVAEALRLDSRVMHKDIGAIVAGDKAVTFGTVKPLNGAGDPLAHGGIILLPYKFHRAVPIFRLAKTRSKPVGERFSGVAETRE